jgi:CubicO group peptidase (beta-lactamase class C family)
MLLSACDNPENNTIKQLDEYLSGQANHYNFNGNVLIAENGKIVFQKSYGLADFKTKRALNDSSVFELASISKQITATAILLLKDQGKLELSDSLRNFLPELPYQGITLHHMLTHTSGLPDYEPMMIEKWDHSKIAFNADMIAVMVKEKPPVLFLPGKKWKYSNTAYALLASIAEKVSGQPFPDFLKENIFVPLKMNHSRIYNTRRSLKDTIPNYAYGYIHDPENQKHTLPDSIKNLNIVYFLDGIQGDGTVNSTTSDLLKWDRSVKNHSLLNESTQQEMLKPHALADTIMNRFYGYGVMLEETPNGPIVAHSGGWPGYSTYLARNINKDQTFIVLSNIDVMPSGAITSALQHIINHNPDPVEMPHQHPAFQIDSLKLVPLTGKYKAKAGFTLTQKGNKLFRTDLNGKITELIPESDRRFYYADNTDRHVEFELDEKTNNLKLWFINYGIRSLYTRVE